MADSLDNAILRVRDLFAESGLTLEELGKRMGYPEATARNSAWQFLNRTSDPRLSMLRKFAQAIGVPTADLLAEKKQLPIPFEKAVEGLLSVKPEPKKVEKREK
jgi:transcriptional regulator with XRE-family HTH domain